MGRRRSTGTPALILGVYILLLMWVVPAAAGDAAVPHPEPLIVETAGGNHPVRVDLALTEAARMRGLMHRDHLADDAGMLFVWPERQLVRMWMKNTLIPLDMLFIGADGRIVHIEHEATPHDLTPRGPDQPVRVVLELPGGTAQRLGVAPGDRVRHPALPGEEP